MVQNLLSMCIVEVDAILPKLPTNPYNLLLIMLLYSFIVIVFLWKQDLDIKEESLEKNCFIYHKKCIIEGIWLDVKLLFDLLHGFVGNKQHLGRNQSRETN